MDKAANLKAEQRSQANAFRAALGDKLRVEYSAAICDRILSMPQIKSAHTVMSYMAFRHEADMAPLHSALRQRGIRLCFPVSGNEGIMEAYAPDETQWIVGRYGITEPDPHKALHVLPDEIDVIIVPCVAFDESRQRIGWGAGYYDRFIPRCKNAFSAAAAFEVQKLPMCVSDSFDVSLDAVVTEQSIY